MRNVRNCFNKLKINILFTHYTMLEMIDRNALELCNTQSCAILQYYGAKRTNRDGSEWRGLCPFHDDKTQSFAMQLDGPKIGQWCCFACGEKGGDIFSFVARKEGLDVKKDFRQVVTMAFNAAGLIPPEDAPARQSSPLPRRPLPPLKSEKPKEPPYYPTRSDFEGQGCFRGWCREYPGLCSYLSEVFEPKAVLSATARYRIYSRRGGWTVFPFIDADARCVDAHLMLYNVDGHRAKGERYNNDWLMRLMSKKERRAPWPVFGEHLLKERPAAPVGIVESEKTALIAAICCDAYIWVAVGGKSNFTADRCRALKGRECFIFPDLDAIEDWEKRAAELNAQGFTIYPASDYIRQNAVGPKCDLGDILISKESEI